MADSLRLPASSPGTVADWQETDYPGEFKKIVAERARQTLGDTLGLQHFGANLVLLAPGAASAQRHWHSKGDEFIMILSDEVVLISDSGEQTLKPGETAGFAAGAADGHHLVNKGSQDTRYFEIGSRIAGDVVSYPDIDLVYLGDDGIFTNKLGKEY